MGHPVTHWQISAKNASTEQAFYTALFDWSFNPSLEGVSMTLPTDNGIGGSIFQGPGNTYLSLYVQVDDVQAYLDKAASLGAKVVLTPMTLPNGRIIATFLDPEGNVINLMKPPAQ